MIFQFQSGGLGRILLPNGGGGPGPDPGPYRYFRLTVTSWVAGGVVASANNAGTVRIAEWQLFDAADTQYPSAVMTTDSAPSPLVASARSVLAGGFEAFHAFDGNTSNSNRYISDTTTTGTEYVQIDLGAGNEILATYFMIAADANVSSPSYNFNIDFQIDASNSGAFAGEEVRILTRSNLGPGDWTPSTLVRFDAP